MDFHWSRYDEGSDEYVCRVENITAYVFRVGPNKWEWLVRAGDNTKGGQEQNTAAAFDQAEQFISFMIQAKNKNDPNNKP